MSLMLQKLRFVTWACLCVSVRACMRTVCASLLLYVWTCLNCVCVCVCTYMHWCVCAFSSPHAVPDRLRLRVNRISLQEYDRLQYDKERLRDICKTLCLSEKWLKVTPVYIEYIDSVSHDWTWTCRWLSVVLLSSVKCFHIFQFPVLFLVAAGRTHFNQTEKDTCSRAYSSWRAKYLPQET